jgi:choline-sulfatase
VVGHQGGVAGRNRQVAWDHLGRFTVLGAENAIRQIYIAPYNDREQPQRPLVLRVGFSQPHYPYLCEEGLFEYYLNRVEPFLDQEVFDHPFLSTKQVRPGIDASEREIRRAVAAYYGMVETIDAGYGRVMKALEAAGQDLDEWIILYCSDHGEMLGEHGVWEKQKFFEGSVRVPLIIRWPKGFQGGRVVEENVSLCDLYATLCDLAGLEIRDGLDSRSLAPLLRGDAVGWDNEVVSQFLGTNFMIKRDAFKYQWYGDDRPEVLFDLERDPGETRNWIDAPEYAEAVAAFRARMAALGHGPAADPDYRDAGYIVRR